MSACWDMVDVHVMSVADAVCGSMHINIIFSSSPHRGAHSKKIMVSLDCPYRHSLCVAVIPLSRCPHSQKPRGLRLGVSAGQLTGPPCSIQCSLKVWTRCCLTVWRKWGDSPSCMNHMCCHWWRDTCSKSTGKSFTKKFWYTESVSVLDNTTGPKCWPVKASTQRMAHPYLRTHWLLDMYWQGHLRSFE
jgi:hypothetical protein